MVVASPRSGARALLLPRCLHRDEALRAGRTALPRVPARLGARASVPAAGT
ncbi:hypothetical protein [Brachybacterium sp. UNK5269]|uniref:hypothetical protein n=1 Tax=Brachybacterium sp. UNK5269 TaxID=3408576 RepID=UPI003BB18F5C